MKSLFLIISRAGELMVYMPVWSIAFLVGRVYLTILDGFKNGRKP